MEKLRTNEDYADAERARDQRRIAARQQDERVKEEKRLYMEIRRKSGDGKAWGRELSRRRKSYQEEKKKKEQLDFDIAKEKLEMMFGIHRDGDIADPGLDYFWDNPLIELGREFYKKLDVGEATRCIVCKEQYPCVETGPRSHKCKRCSSKNQTFRKNNNLTPEDAPECLKVLNQVELAAIRQNCPIMQIFSRGSSKGARGHCICLMQDVKSFASVLPHKPQDLPYLYLKNPRESVTDKFFEVRREPILTALRWLKKWNPYYQDITISEENAREYPVEGILQNIRSADPDAYNIPEEAPSAAGPEENTEDNEESAFHGASTVDIPAPHQDAMNMFRQALQKDPQLGDQGRAIEGEQEGLPDIDAIEAEEERALHESLDLNESFHPSQPEDAAQMEWPKRARGLASEFEPGFFARCYPELFPRNIDREEEEDGSITEIEDRRETGDITEVSQVNFS